MSSTMTSPPPPPPPPFGSSTSATLTPASLIAAPPSPSSSSSFASHSHSHSCSNSATMAATAQAVPHPSSVLSNVHVDTLDSLVDEEADPMLAAAYLLSFMREQGGSLTVKPPHAPCPGGQSRSATSAAVHSQQHQHHEDHHQLQLPHTSQQDEAMHDAVTPVLEPAIPPGLPSTMDIGDRASQSSLAAPPSLAIASSPGGRHVASSTAGAAAAAAPGSGTGVLIPSTTKKSSTRCKSLPSVLEYPDYLIPLNAPIQHKTASQSLSQASTHSLPSVPEGASSAASSLSSLSASSTLAPGARAADAPPTPGRNARKRTRGAAVSSDEGDLAMDAVGPRDNEPTKRARVTSNLGTTYAFPAMHTLSLQNGSRDGSPAMDDDPALPSSQPPSGTRARKGSRRAGMPMSMPAAAATGPSSSCSTPPQVAATGRPSSTTAAAAAKAANEAVLKEVVPDLSSLDPKEAKRVRNTLSARASRARKAAKIEFLETRVNDLEAMMDVVVEENALLRKLLADAGVQGVPEPKWAAMPGAAPWPEQFRDSAPLFIGAQCGAAGGEGAEDADVDASQSFAAGSEQSNAASSQNRAGKGRKAKSQGSVSCQGSPFSPMTPASVSISVSAPGSIDGDAPIDDDCQQLDARYPASSTTSQQQPWPVSPNLSAPIPLPSRPTSPASTSHSFSSASSASGALPPISAVVGDMSYLHASAPFPRVHRAHQGGGHNPPGSSEFLYPPSYSHPGYSGGSAPQSTYHSQQHSSAGSSPSVSPVHTAFQLPPLPSSAPSTSSR